MAEIHEAVRRGNIDETRRLLSEGADANARDARFVTPPLFSALVLGHSEIVRLLVEYGADVNAEDKGGCTPLQTAVLNGNRVAVKLLLENGADVNPKRKDGWTPLIAAVVEGYSQISMMLVEYGVNINEDIDGTTALMFTAQVGDVEMVRVLLDGGAYANAKDRDGATALQMASEHGHTEVAALMSAYGADCCLREDKRPPVVGWARTTSRTRMTRSGPCESCSIGGVRILEETRIWFALLCIHVIPGGTHYRLVCPICHSESKLTRSEYEELKAIVLQNDALRAELEELTGRTPQAGH